MKTYYQELNPLFLAAMVKSIYKNNWSSAKNDFSLTLYSTTGLGYV